MKNFMAEHCDFTFPKLRKNLPLTFAQVTSKTCQKLIAKTVAEENIYWLEDRKIDVKQGIDVA
jgi:hypothetical protein